MDRKAQTTVGQVLIAMFIFAALTLGSFTFFMQHLAENEVVVSDTVNQTAFYETFGTKEENSGKIGRDLDSASNQTFSEKESVLSAIPGWDFFATGINSIKAGWRSIGFMIDYVNFVKGNTLLGNILPSTFWGMLISIFTIILVLVVLGALWRYKLTP